MHPNHGQWDDRIQYKMDLDFGDLLIENQGLTYQLYDLKIHKAHDEPNYSPKFHIIKTHFVNSQTPTKKTEQSKSSYYRNYFIGKDKSKWQTHINDIQDVVFNKLYPGIDIHYSSLNNQLKYSLVIEPNTNSSVIEIEISGSDKLTLTGKGDLEIESIFGKIIESAPIAYTVDENGNSKDVNCKFILENNKISFELGNYNHQNTLIIDPQLTFSTFTGSTADNWGFTACSDLQGNLFAGGIVFGAGYPTTTGVIDATYNNGAGTGGTYHIDMGITKFNATGTTLLYSTYLGGSGNETPNSIVSNSAGELFIMGATSSHDYPTTTSAYQPAFGGGVSTTQNDIPFPGGTDLFITRLSVAGDAIIASTYLGGSDNEALNYGSPLTFNYGDQFRGMVEVDQNSNVYFASTTHSSNFPKVNSSTSLSGAQDAVYGKFDPNLSMLFFSAYFGGTGYEAGNAIQLSHAGDIYMVGGTNSSTLPLGTAGIHSSFLGGLTDGFVVKINPTSGIVSNGTFLGTNDYDQAYFVQLDLDDKVYVLGQTRGAYPISSGVYNNPQSGQFIHKLSNNLATTEWSTTIGAGTGWEEISPTAFLVSDCYDIYFSGWGGLVNAQNSLATHSSSNGFPITTNAYQSTTSGNNFYIAVLKKDALSLKYATYFGGVASSYNHVDGGTSQFDKQGRIYHAVCGACGGNDFGFTTTPGVWSTTNNSSNCNLAAFKFELNSIESIIGNIAPIICMPNPVVFTNNSLNGNFYVWNFGDGTNSFDENPTHNYTSPGNYIISLIAIDTNNCYISDTAYFDITLKLFNGAVQVPSTPICPDDTLQLHASGGTTYAWSPSQFMDDSTSATPLVSVHQNTTFQVIVSDSCGTDTLSVLVQVLNSGFSVIGDTILCIGDTIPLNINVSGFSSISWHPDSIFVDNHVNPAYCFPTVSTNIDVDLVTSEGCLLNATHHISVDSTIPQIIVPDPVFYCENSGAQVNASGGRSYLWSPNYFISTTNLPSIYINSPKDTMYTVEVSNGCGNSIDSVHVHIIQAKAKAGNDTIICPGESAYVWASGGVSYQWSPTQFLSDPNSNMSYATPTIPTHLRVIVTDSIGCSDTAYVYVKLFQPASVDAGPDYFGFIGDEITLTAKGQGTGIYSWYPTEYVSCVNCQSTNVSPPKNATYIVKFTNENGCSATDDVSIHFDGIIYVPNTFTPNSDKFNTIFKAVGGNILSFDMKIFDRWGELIFETKDLSQGWNGTYNGEDSPDGVYVWKIRYVDIEKQIPQEIIGHVTLIR